MADKSIFELNLQTTFASNDRLVVGNYANSDAEAITGQTLVNLLATSLDGHGGIQSITKTSSSGTNPVVDTYTILMADETTTTFSVTNGIKGDTGAQTFVYFRWAHEEPTTWADTTSQPDEWMGVYAGTATTPPTTVNSYTWIKVRGDKGDTGDASEITTQEVGYQESASGVVVPDGSWTSTVPSVSPGNFLWTRTRLAFNDGSTINAYSVSRFGIDGSGSVSTVNNVSPDGNGNIALTASNVPTLDSTSVQSHITGIEDAVGDISDLSGFTATDLVGAANELKEDLDNVSVDVVYVGTSTPSDPNIKIWLDTDEPGMSGVSSVNGKTGTVVLDALDVDATEWTLLWENASPSSQFAAQDVSLDLLSYDAVYINYTYTNNEIYSFAVIPVGMTSHIRYVASTSSNIQFSGRDTTVSANKITFADATTQTQGSSSSSTANARLIPYNIYGIKGFKNS